MKQPSRNIAESSEPRRIIILGSTGSIGVGALDVIAHLATVGGAESGESVPTFEVVGLAAGRRADVLERQADRFSVRNVALADPAAAGALSPGRSIRTGPDAAVRLVEDVARPGDLVVAAMVGAAGIPSALAAIGRGCDIALANKETLVAAGALVTAAAAEAGVGIIPIDSEHAALHQCLRSGRDPQEVSRLVLTASGGPFRTWSADRIRNATVEEALNHPTWKMGPKVTIDSATMMNKGLELIEAHWLFGIDADRLEAIIHPQSIVHSFVEFLDGSSLAQLSPPDMRMPIQYALCHPIRVPGCAPSLDYQALRELVFEPVDHDRFPSIELARSVIRAGGTAGAIFNAANEVAAEAFCRGGMAFGRITDVVAAVVDQVPIGPASDLDAVMAADGAARDAARAHASTNA
jgi:1-deoxy-D-xylulose-5-phosphate reductoisomerase